MSGLKSGSGDDLWDEDEDENGDEDVKKAEAEQANQTVEHQAEDTASGSESATEPASGSTANAEPSDERRSQEQATQPYIVRRAIQDKSVQFERDERLTFFVHRDVVDGERELVNEVESTLERDVPKFDVREAVYRAALQNREDVLAELLKMGYSLPEE